MKKIIVGFAVLTFMAFTACSGDSRKNSLVSYSDLKAESLPASGARYSIKSEGDIASVIKSFGEKRALQKDSFVNFFGYADALFEEMQNSLRRNSRNRWSMESTGGNGFLVRYDSSGRKYFRDIGREFGNSKYFETLGNSFNEQSRKINKVMADVPKTGKINISISEKPGYAKDLREGLEFGIPYYNLRVDGTASDEKGNLSGSAGGAFEVSVDGFKFEIPSVSINAGVNVKDYARSVKFNGSFDGSANLSIDPSKFEINDSFLKGFEASAAVNGSANMNMDKGEVEYDINSTFAFSSGISFVAPNKTGGKVIFAGKVKLKGEIGLTEREFSKLQRSGDMSFLMDDVDVEKFFADRIMSEKDFKALNLPFDISCSIKFYDDDDKETFCLIDAANLYEFYKVIYEYLDKYEVKESLVKELSRSSSKYDYDDYRSYSYDDYDRYDRYDHYEEVFDSVDDDGQLVGRCEECSRNKPLYYVTASFAGETMHAKLCGDCIEEALDSMPDGASLDYDPVYK